MGAQIWTMSGCLRVWCHGSLQMKQTTWFAVARDETLSGPCGYPVLAPYARSGVENSRGLLLPVRCSEDMIQLIGRRE